LVKCEEEEEEEEEKRSLEEPYLKI